MKINIIQFFLLIFCFFIVNSCNKSNSTGKGRDTSSKLENLPISFASGFSIQQTKAFRKITIFNPWQGARNISFRYFLSPVKPGSLNLGEGTWIRTPARRIVCLSTTQIGMIEFIHEISSIVGVSGAQYICNPELQKRIAEGKVKDVGYDINLNYELIYSLKPDLVLIYGVNSEASSLYDRLNSFGIPALFIGEYLEQSPLAKAEWVKLIGSLFNKDSMVAKDFGKMADEYLSLQKLSSATSSRPVVMTGLPWKEAWNVAGGESFTAHLIADAGGKYLWSERKTRDNIPMNLEQAVSDSKNADIWINSGIARSISDILATDERLGKLSPILKGRVFNNNKVICQGGGNDFWESGVVHPELILKDLIMIFHPELNINKDYSYYKKLN